MVAEQQLAIATNFSRSCLQQPFVALTNSSWSRFFAKQRSHDCQWNIHHQQSEPNGHEILQLERVQEQGGYLNHCLCQHSDHHADLSSKQLVYSSLIHYIRSNDLRQQVSSKEALEGLASNEELVGRPSWHVCSYQKHGDRRCSAGQAQNHCRPPPHHVTQNCHEHHRHNLAQRLLGLSNRAQVLTLVDDKEPVTTPSRACERPV
mmetsp:Transcript_42206/g.76488  ORF Transcript_42206/g.76488 Transcript_42206/m.76488 type:complete len:205 (+) Transcript_42206:37-651(+)